MHAADDTPSKNAATRARHCNYTCVCLNAGHKLFTFTFTFTFTSLDTGRPRHTQFRKDSLAV